jgi:hypothetical protein
MESRRFDAIEREQRIMIRRMPIATAATALALALGAPSAFAQEAANYRLQIVEPADEATVSSDVGIRASVAPQLARGDDVEVLLDGESVSAPTSALEFRVADLAPGPHLLQARIIDSTGNVGSISPPSFFYVSP